MKNWRMFSILAGIAILVLAQIQIAFADENSWSTGGPYDASVWSIAIHPFDSLQIYIGTLERFLFKTTNGGAEWIPTGGPPDANPSPSMLRVIVVKIHPFGPDTLFAATGRGAYKSTDAGQTWSLMSPLHGYEGWDALEINHENPPVLFLGTWGSCWRSTDGGETWVQTGGNNHQLTGVIKAIKADPVRPNIIYVGNNTQVPYASIWKSTDSGLTWSNIHNNLPWQPMTRYAEGIAIDPVDPEIVYFARQCFDEAEDALVKSTNGGEYWTDITPDSLAANCLYGVAVSPLDHNTVFVCSEMNGILRSTDGGTSWEEINEGIIGSNTRTQSVVFDSATGILYHGRHSGGIYRSTDSGDSWEKISYNITGSNIYDIAANFRNPDTLYTATPNGLYMSTDAAANWEYIELNFPDDDTHLRTVNVEVDPYDPSYVYISYSGHSGLGPSHGVFYRSTDGGANWESFTQGLLPGRSYSKIAVADYGGGTRRLFMTSREGLFFSDDLGESWSLCGGGLPLDIDLSYIDASPVNPDLVYVGKQSPSDIYLYKSTDGGVSWAPLTNSPVNITQIVCDPINPDIVYISGGHWGEGELYKSTDGGNSWAEISNNIPHPEDIRFFNGLAVNPLNHDNVFVWSCDRGIFQSHDGGQSWEDFTENMETTYSASCTLIDPIDTSRVFVGFGGNSIWEITRTQTGIAAEENNLPAAFSSLSYPNPFNPSTVIEYSLPEEAFVTVDIYDMLGRKVKTLVNAEQEAGQHQVIWDAENQASGVYFYKIDAGESTDMRKMILLK